MSVDNMKFTSALQIDPSRDQQSSIDNVRFTKGVSVATTVVLVTVALGIIGATAYFAPYYVPVSVIAISNPKTLALTNKLFSAPQKAMHDSAKRTHEIASSVFTHFNATKKEDIPEFLADHGFNIDQTDGFKALTTQLGSRDKALESIRPLVATFKTWKEKELEAWKGYYALLDEANALANTGQTDNETLSQIATLRLKAYKLQTEELLPAKITTVYYFSLLSNLQNKTEISDVGTFTALEFHHREALTNENSAVSQMKKVSTIADTFFTTTAGTSFTREQLSYASYTDLARGLFS